MTLSISLQLLGGGLEVVHVVIDPLEAVLRDRDTVDDLRQRRALRAGQQLPLAALISLGMVGIEAQRRDERVAETNVNEIRAIELYLDGKVIDLNLRPTAQHRCTESTNPEAKLLQQPRKSTVVFKAPSPSTIEHLGDNRVGVGRDRYLRNHVKVFERNRGEVRVLQRCQRLERRGRQARVSDVFEVRVQHFDPMQFSPRVSELVHSPIGAAHALLAHRVNDRPLLDLSQAAPSYSPAPVVVERIAQAAEEADTSKYAPQPGLPELRAAFAADVASAYDADIAPDDTLITAGCNQAFCTVISALAGPGDNVVLALPFYFNHDMWLRVEGIEPRYLKTDDRLHPSATAAHELIDERTRAIVLVTPGNPSGVTYPPELIDAFADLTVERGVALLVDETYRSFRPTTTPAHRLYDRPHWRDHVVTLHSFSKDLAIPGYRVGGLIAGEAARVEALKIFDCIAISAPAIGQTASATGLTEAATWRQEQADRTRDLQAQFEDVMAEQPGGFALVTAGAYFGWVRAPGNEPTVDVVQRLVIEHDVLTIPGTAFMPTDEQMIRFSFANLAANEITELGRRLAQWRR